MEQLQNNFTTPEQSKRLLELGVPILTADCYYYVFEVNGKNVCNEPFVAPFGMGEYGLKRWWAGKYNDRYIPCWSVGRLIEIAFICSVYEARTIDFFRNDTAIYDIIYELENSKMDFSKLEK